MLQYPLHVRNTPSESAQTGNKQAQDSKHKMETAQSRREVSNAIQQPIFTHLPMDSPLLPGKARQYLDIMSPVQQPHDLMEHERFRDLRE